MEIADVLQFGKLGEPVHFGPGERRGEVRLGPFGPPGRVSRAVGVDVHAQPLGQDPDLDHPRGAVHGDPRTLEPFEVVVPVVAEGDGHVGVVQQHGGRVLATVLVGEPGGLVDPGVDGFGGAEYAHQGIEHVAAENPQPTAHVRRLVEVLGEVFAGQCRPAGGNGHDLTDEPGLDQLLCPGDGFGESDVVADLHDEISCERPRHRAAEADHPPCRHRASPPPPTCRQPVPARCGAPCRDSWNGP